MPIVNKDMLSIKNKQKIVVEAGELRVPKDDTIIPTKLRLLGATGWNVVDAWRIPESEGGGFNLLLTRKVDPDYRQMLDREAEANILKEHAGTGRCPQYCGCMND
jgi:hypothetical protein